MYTASDSLTAKDDCFTSPTTPDDGVPGCVGGADVNTFANRVPGKLAPRERFVDQDGHRHARRHRVRRAGGRGGAGCPSFEVARCHGVSKRAMILVRILSLDLELHAIRLRVAAQRQLAGQRRRRDAGNAAYRFQRLREEPMSVGVIVESVTGRLHLHCEQVRRVKPGTTANRRCRLRSSKPALTSSTSASATSATTSARRVNWCPPAVRASPAAGPAAGRCGRAQRRNQPDHQPDQRGDANSESEDGCRRGRSRHARQPAGLSATNARTPIFATTIPTAPPMSASSRLSVSSCRIMPCSSGAKRGAHREFAAPLCAASEQQIRHVHARDQQDQHDGAEDGEQRRFHAA